MAAGHTTVARRSTRQPSTATWRGLLLKPLFRPANHQRTYQAQAER
ncbi:MAG: hypothetical protein ACRYFV_12445 [Janthinobacterium lividum]